MNRTEDIGRQRSGAQIILRCMGRFWLQDGAGNELQLPARKSRALLAYLALSTGPAPREQLADLLWSDRGPVQARASLRQTIFEMQHFGLEKTSLLITDRENVAISREALVTDRELIRSAATDDDWPRLQSLLQSCGPGFLADLDGLDYEFDHWLRVQRATEPLQTLAMAVASAERCAAESGPRRAAELIGEVLRLDPVNEESRRLAMRLTHQLGDQGATHRHFAALSDQLRDEFGVGPSKETISLYEELIDPGRQDEPSARERASERDGPGALGHAEARKSEPGPWLAAVAILLLVVLASTWSGLRAKRQIPEDGKTPLIAVLPFEHVAESDAFIAEGMWEDTRSALSRAGIVRVLGRATTIALVKKHSGPEIYRRRLGVTHLLEGSVQRTGERIRVNVTLINSSNGQAVWNDRLEGRLGDPLVVQEAVAQAIEGRLRGRLAAGGGRRPSQIATSPEVYALYSEANALLRTRNTDEARRANRLLLQAVARDPNFAPAWSALAIATRFGEDNPAAVSQRHEAALRYAGRALLLAPNLADAHATIGYINGNSAEALQALKRAVTLDPGNAEAWNWLGNASIYHFERKAAASHYWRAVEIDPLWAPAVLNLTATLAEIRDNAAARRLLAKVAKAGGSQDLLLSMRFELNFVRGDYSEAIGPSLSYAKKLEGAVPNSIVGSLAEGLTALGYYEEAARLEGYEQWYGPLLRGDRLPPERIDGRPLSPSDFWSWHFMPSYGSRAMLNRGRADLLLDYYHEAFRSEDEFISLMNGNSMLDVVAPNVAIALEPSSPAKANYLLAAAARPLELAMENGNTDRDIPWRLARIRAVQGRPAEAVRLLAKSVYAGWLPGGWWCAIDLADEPALRRLKGRPEFERLRQRILDDVSRERAELGPISV